MIKLDTNLIDTIAKENIRKLQQEFDGNPILNGEWKLFEETFDAAENKSFPHSIPFLPSDLIITKDEVGAVITFDRTNVTIDAVQAGTVRFILGRMKK